MKKDNLTRRDFVKSSFAGAVAATPLLARNQPIGTDSQAGGNGNILTGAVICSDMSQCQPSEAVSRGFEKDRWQLIDYETVEGLKGTMASAKPESRCAALTLPLNVEGLYKIYFGINYTKAEYLEWPSYGQLEVKLSTEDGFRRVALESGSLTESGRPKIGVNREIYNSIQQVYWKTADLTGKNLVFRQPTHPPSRAESTNISNLSYLKLVPLGEEEKRQWREQQPSQETRKLAVIYCTAQMSAPTRGGISFHPIAQNWFVNEFTPYLDSDFKIFIFEALRGNYCLYRSSIGDVGSEDNRWHDNWIDPLSAFTRLAHDNGLKIFASMRMIGPQYPMNRSPIGRARHYWKHPEWSKLDRDGVPLSNWSIAFPEVRHYWLSLLRETLEYGIDGIQLHLNRSTPFVFYEQPVVQRFQEEYGEDPRKLPESDTRWQIHCAGYVTQFIREVRRLVDEKPGRELGLTIYGEAHKYDKEPNFHPIRYNCDVETWLREQLADYVMPSPRVDLTLLKKWREIAGNRVHLWPDLMPRTQPAEKYATLAKQYYEAGADGFCLWDGEGRPPHISEWAAVQRLGHRKLLNRLIEESPSYHARIMLKYLSGFSVRESFHDG